jgi:hypothetical protein
VVRPPRFERGTFCSGGKRSIQAELRARKDSMNSLALRASGRLFPGACESHTMQGSEVRKMVTSPEDARLLFKRWNEDSSPLRIKLRSAAVIFEGVGLVETFNSGALNLGGNSWQLVIPLEGASFTFSDPREASVASVREAEAARYEFGLSLNLGNGDRLALMELKTADAEPASEEAE